MSQTWSSDTVRRMKLASRKSEKTQAMPIMQKLSTHFRLGKKKNPEDVEARQDNTVRRPRKLEKPLARLKKRKSTLPSIGETDQGRSDNGNHVPEVEIELMRAGPASQSDIPTSRGASMPGDSRLSGKPSPFSGSSPERNLKAHGEQGQDSRLASISLASATTRFSKAINISSLNTSVRLSSQHTQCQSFTGPSCGPYEDAEVSQESWEPIIRISEPGSTTQGPRTNKHECSDNSENENISSISVSGHREIIDQTIYWTSDPFRDGSGPGIRDTDSSTDNDDGLPGLPGSYYDNFSPVDSAVDVTNRIVATYNGKGKGRANREVSNNPYFGSLWSAMAGLKQEEADVQHEARVLPYRTPSREQARKLAAECWHSLEELERQVCKEDRKLALQLQAQFDRQKEQEDRLNAELAQAARSRDCIVCGDSKEIDEFPIERTTSNCDHSVNVCSECLNSWMTSEFETKGVSGIGCPECREALSHSDVQRAASAETFAAYDKLTTRETLAGLPGFEWCLGVNCGSGQLNYDNEHLPNFMRCVSCGYSQCLKHKTQWHNNETCEQFDYRTSGQKARDEEAKTEAMLNDISKMCPGPPGKPCGCWIQKTEGCDHMTCRRCLHQFCYRCLASMDEIRRVGNTAHKTDCKYHSHNLHVAWPFNAH